MPPEGLKVSENGIVMWLMPTKSTSWMSSTPLAKTPVAVPCEPGVTLPAIVVSPLSLRVRLSIRLFACAITMKVRLPSVTSLPPFELLAAKPSGLKSIEFPVTVGAPKSGTGSVAESSLTAT